MPRLNTRNYHFEWTLDADSELSRYQRAHIHNAIRETLTQIPIGVMKQNLATQSSYFLSVQFVSPRQIQKLNQAFLQKDRPTDVLSFGQLPDKSGVPEASLGDLALCLPIIERNAKRFKVSLREELHRMITHGILHLFGYTHEGSQTEATKMFRLQERIVTGSTEIKREWLE